MARRSGGREVSLDVDCKRPPDLKMLNCFWKGLLELGRLSIALNLKVTCRVQPSIFIEEEKEGSFHSLDDSHGPALIAETTEREAL